MYAQRCCGVRQDNDENWVVGTEWITWGSLLTLTRTIIVEWSKSLMRAGWGMWKRRLDKFYCEAMWPWAVSNFLWPLDCSRPGSSVHGILQARMPEWVAISHCRGIFLTQGSSPHLLHLPHWQADSLPILLHGKPFTVQGREYLMATGWRRVIKRGLCKMGITKACCHGDEAIQLGGIYPKKNEDRSADSVSLRGHREGLGLNQEQE